METKKIYTAIVEIMDDIKSIGKDRYNKMQSYSFRGIDDVYNALQPALIKHKVFCVPTVKSVKREDGVSAKGTPLKYTVVDVDYEFTSAEDGSSIKISMSGEAMDSGDKSLNKALSAAYKYACFQLFCIPTESESHDSEEDTYEYHQKVESKQEVPKQTDRKIAEQEIASFMQEVHRTGCALDKMLKKSNVKVVKEMKYSCYLYWMNLMKKTPDKKEEEAKTA